ncbi:hypothetical protein HY379_02375 [Candidatus Saccharibacteria bacterium]|nr:hypothetical protein [Candidatus Saccharibacteria bacterium]
MNDLGREFYHLKEAAKDGIDRGDPSVAELLFQSYSDEARRTHVFELKRLAAMKAQAIADVLKTHDPTDLSRLPNPSNDPPPVWQVGKGGKGDPLKYVRLNAHQEWAVGEIRAIYSATVRPLMAIMKPLDTPRVDRSREPPNPLRFMEHLSPERLHRYFNWCREQRRPMKFKTGTEKKKNIRHWFSGLEYIDLVMAVLIDGYKFREIGRAWGLDGKQVNRAFRRSLNKY